MSDTMHSDSHSAMDSGHGGHGSHGGNAKYFYVFFALCALTLMSFWTSGDLLIPWPFRGQPAVGRAFMMAVSCTKAMLVIMFFMHLKWEANWKYVLTIPAGMMSLFLMLMLVPDVGLRMNLRTGNAGPSQERVARAASPEQVKQLGEIR